MTKVYVNKDRVEILQTDVFIEGKTSPYDLSIAFSEEWYGLEKHLLFKSDAKEDMVITQAQEITFAIPADLFKAVSDKLLFRVYGYKGCELATTTRYASILGEIKPTTPDPIILSAPIGTVVAWTGKIEDIPASYALCDGQNGTPDLRNSFIIGAGGAYPPGSTNKALSVDNIPNPTEYNPLDPESEDLGYYSLCFIQKIYLTDLDKKESMTAYEIAIQQGFVGDEKEWLASLRGKSAYQVAVDNGFTGTETQWLETLARGIPTLENITITNKADSPFSASSVYLMKNVSFVSIQRATHFIDNQIVYTVMWTPTELRLTDLENNLTIVQFRADGLISSISFQSLSDQILSSVKTVKGEPGDSAYEIAVKNGFVGDEQSWLASLKGEDGRQGVDGVPGKDGKDGKDGAKGADGAPGADGASAYQIAVKNGFSGSEQTWLASLKGADGKDGARGPIGLTGPAGADGTSGEDGKSAYELAVKHGFRGTEAEWVESLKGQDGVDGKDGAPGKDGETGPEGKRGLPGDSAYDIARSRGFVGTEDEWLESLHGKNGQNGRDGKDGDSAYQLAVKNGFNGTEKEWLNSIIADFNTVVRYCGSVASFELLPAGDNKIGDMYNTLDTGMNYAWDGDTWDPMGSTFKFTTADLDEVQSIVGSDVPVSDLSDPNAIVNLLDLRAAFDKLSEISLGADDVSDIYSGDADTSNARNRFVSQEGVTKVITETSEQITSLSDAVNAQLDDLDGAIEGLSSSVDTRLDELEETINETVSTQIYEVKTSISSLETKVNVEVAGQIEELETKVNTDVSSKLTELESSVDSKIGSVETSLSTLESSVTSQISSALPAGVITMWSGAADAIPEGWVLCDGQNGTPDLRSRFVMGAGDTVAPGTTGGNSSATLSVDNLPAHSHSYTSTAVSVTGTTGGSLFSGGEGTVSVSAFSDTTDATGSGTAFGILPPYYALCYIMKT